MTETTSAFLDQCRAIVGADYVLDLDSDKAAFLTDQRGRYTGRALAVLRPATVAEVAALVRACAQWRVPIVPQGGNTGLVLGSVPDAGGGAVVLSLARMNAVRPVSYTHLTLPTKA